MNARAESRNDAAPIAGRLPSLSRDDAERLRRLASGRRRFALPQQPNGAWLDISGRHADASPWIVLGVSDARIAIALDDEAGGGEDNESHWSDFDGESRLVAWSLAHERTLAMLGDVLGARVVPLEFEGETPSEGGAAIGVRVGDEAGFACAGALRVPTEWLDRLMTDERGQPIAAESSASAQSRVPATLSVTLDGPALSGKEIASLRSGDVIVAGSKSRAIDHLRIDDGARTWRARWNDQSLHVIEAGPAAGSPQWRPTMSAVKEEEGAKRGVSDIPVRIEFAIGEITLPFGELERIEAGYVFELGRSIETASVDIRANGRPIARGQLVAIGDTLGVRITENGTDGLQ